jgi:hypothetical protein
MIARRAAFVPRMPRFTVRSLLIAVTLIGIGCAWIAQMQRDAERERDAVRQIRDHCGFVVYDFQNSADGRSCDTDLEIATPWPKSILGGYDFWYEAHAVSAIDGTGAPWLRADFGDKEVSLLLGFRRLEQLSLYRTSITDDALKIVGQLKYLEMLNLGNTAITDEGIKRISPLKKLRNLLLESTEVTDAAVPAIAAIESLQSVSVWNSKMTERGVDRLRRLRSDLEISFVWNVTFKPDPKAEEFEALMERVSALKLGPMRPDEKTAEENADEIATFQSH